MYGKPELKERTRNRLMAIEKIGMSEVMTAEFGVPGIMSGLYIEMVWDYTDDKFEDYLIWAKSLIYKKGK